MQDKEKEKGSIGTTITLGRSTLAETIWGDDLDRIRMNESEESDSFPFAEAARHQQIFLDYLLFRTRELSHLLVGERFDSILKPGERKLRDALERFVKDLTADDAKEIRETVVWQQIKLLLKSLGCDLDNF